MTTDQHKDLKTRKKALKRYLDIDKKTIEIEELQEQQLPIFGKTQKKQKSF
jgi:hypothetical protein